MGEAKRRKDLGLMPRETTLRFTVERGQAPQLEGQADDETRELMRRHIAYRLGDTEGAWDREYRRAYLLDADQELETREALNNIATARYVRGSISLVTNKPDMPSEDALPVLGREGEWLRFKALEASFDGHTWQPRRAHVDGIALMMTGHRALMEEEGDPTEVFFEMTRDGQVTFSGEEAQTLSEAAQAGLREELSYWYGLTPEEWDNEYREYIAYFGGEELSDEQLAALPTPQARRGSVLLQPDHIILPPFHLSSFLIPGYQVSVNLDDESITFDGNTWTPLPGSDQQDDEDVQEDSPEDSQEDTQKDDSKLLDN